MSGDVTVVETGTTSYTYADLGVTVGQQDAAYNDVTLLGVYGPVQDVRPLDNDQFTQVRLSEQGIQVKRHISGMQLGPSCNVADLVLYLMEEGNLLKSHRLTTSHCCMRPGSLKPTDCFTTASFKQRTASLSGSCALLRISCFSHVKQTELMV